MAFNWLEHDCYMSLLVMRQAERIKSDGHKGFGTITLDFRHGTLVKCMTTVRDHPPKRLTLKEQDSHVQVGEVPEGDREVRSE